MESNNQNFDVASEVVALATVCGQTFMGEDKSGALILAYNQDASDLGNPRPYESNVRFTMVDGRAGLNNDLATWATVNKILTSGQVFDKNGMINPYLSNMVDAEAQQDGSLLGLAGIDARNPMVRHSAESVRTLSDTLVSSLANSATWVNNFAERARILRDVSAESNNVIINDAVLALSDLMQNARDINKKNAITKINDEVLSR